MPSVGEMLRNARLRKGLSMEQVEAQTRIRRRFLEALESDHFEDIPGKFFARSFALQYGGELGLDSDELTAALDRQIPKPEPEAIEFRENPIDVPPLVSGAGSRRDENRWTSPVVVLLTVLIVCSIVYTGWMRLTQGGNEMAQFTPQTAPAATPGATPTPQATPTPAAALPAPVPTPDPTTVELTPASTQTAPAGKIAIGISAKEDTWVQVTIDGKVVFADVLKPGENRVMSATQNAKVRLGNAGGVDMRFNGNTIGAVGPRGQVRTVEFTPENFLIVEPPKKSADPATRS